MNTDNPNMEAALRYAQLGWHVLPIYEPDPEGCSCWKKEKCTSIGKHPRLENGFYGASTDPDMIRKWWTMWPAANVAIRTGKNSRLVVLDVDRGHGGGESLTKYQELYGKLPNTLEAGTGCGEHLYFTYPENMDHVGSSQEFANLVGLDLRADEAYVVAPPSLHANGKRYAWRNEMDPVDTPASIVTLGLPLGLVPDAAPDAGKGVVSLLQDLHEGVRNPNFFRVTSFLHQRGLHQDMILALLKPHAAACNFDQKELTQIVIGTCRRYADNFNRLGPKSLGEEAESIPPLQAVSLSNLLQTEFPPVRWIVEGLLPRQGAAILAGQEARGKTWALMDLALCVVNGLPWFGKFKTEPCRVLYVDYENAGFQVQERMNMLIGDGRVRRQVNDLLFTFPTDIRFNTPMGFHRLNELIKEQRPGLVIIDSLIRSFDGDENSSRDISLYLSSIKRLIREHDLTVIFADHHRKMGQFQALNQMVRGSSDKAAFVESLMSIQKDEDILTITHTKSRNAKEVPAFQVKMFEKPNHGIELSYCGELRVEKAKATQEQLLEVLRTALAEKDQVTRQELKDLALDEGIKEKAMDKTLDYLLKDGYIVREEVKEPGKRGAGKHVYRWAQTPSRPVHPDLGGEAA